MIQTYTSTTDLLLAALRMKLTHILIFSLVTLAIERDSPSLSFLSFETCLGIVFKLSLDLVLVFFYLPIQIALWVSHLKSMHCKVLFCSSGYTL